MTIETSKAQAQNVLVLNIPAQAVSAAAEVIRKRSSPADRAGLDQALASFENALPSGLDNALNKRIYGSFDALRSAVRLAQSVTHAEPVSLLGQVFQGAARSAISRALDSATPASRDNLNEIAWTLEKRHPAIFYAAKVCVASATADPRNDLNTSF